MSAALDFLVPLFVPGNRPDRFEKAAASGADAVIIDLEDAVATDHKEVARAGLRSNFTTLPVLVRINAIGTPWHEADRVALSNDDDFASVVVPKAEATEAFAALCVTSRIPVIALIETAQGVADARRIASIANVRRIAFGSIDFCADLGCAHDDDALLAVRSELVLASRLSGLIAPIDGVTTAIDDDTVKLDAHRARGLGFGGKLCIHPRQVGAILAGFAPDVTEVEWARKVLSSEGGATMIDGMMVDEPVRIRAKAILKRFCD